MKISREDLLYLTSEKTEGRVSGSKGAKLTANYIAKELAKLGVQPIGENNFFSFLDIHAARLEGPVLLTIGEKIFQHRRDFGEISKFSNPTGNKVTGRLKVVYDGEDVDPSDLKGNVILISKRPTNLDLASTVKSAKEVGVAALLIESGEPSWFSKSLNGSREDSIPVFRVRKKIAEELVQLEGELVNIELPLISRALKCQNVLGRLPGKDQSKTLIISAHYDHIGDDPKGYRFPGAVDNASGVAISLAIARRLAKEPKLPVNIIFAFFTGEESGLIGAKHFIENYRDTISAAINVDSIGFEPKLIKMRNGHSESGNWLADLSAKVIENHHVEVAWIRGGEDSVAFQSRGITAIGLGQKPTDPAQREIHTPDDTLETLFLEPIEQGYKIIYEIIEEVLQYPERL